MKLNVRFAGAELFKRRFIKYAEMIGDNLTIKIVTSGHGGSTTYHNQMKRNVNKKKYNRDPFFLTTKERKKFRDRIDKGIQRELAGSKGAYKRSLHRASEWAVETFREHVTKYTYKSTPKLLNDHYRKWKEKNYPGQPMMKLTGDLINGLNYKIRKSR